jgi:hypothetical protein
MSDDHVDPDGSNDEPGLTPIFEWMYRMTTADPSAVLSFKIDPILISSPAYRAALTRRIAKFSLMLGLKVQLATTEDDAKSCRITIVRPK